MVRSIPKGTDSKIVESLRAEEEDPRPLVISGCEHGVTESWKFKLKLLEILPKQTADLNIVARGVQPLRKMGWVQEMVEEEVIVGADAVVVLPDEILDAVLIVIHESKLMLYNARFGSRVIDVLKKEGYLIVRTNRRADMEGHRACKKNKTEFAWKKEYKQILERAKKRGTVRKELGYLAADIIANDQAYQGKRNKNGNRKVKKGRNRG